MDAHYYEHTLTIMNNQMNKNYFISTNHQKVLSFLTKFSDQEFYEREIARRIGISSGSANQVLNDLYQAQLVKRKQRGKMFFYSINKNNALFRPFKILNNIIILAPLIEELKKVTQKIILYGSCARGEDTSESDVDLFILSDQKDKVLRIITQYSPGKGFESIKIQPIIQSPQEAMAHENKDKEFYSLIREGIVLWESPIDESRF